MSPNSSTATLLVSPEGERYVLVSRDAGRTTDETTLPDGWELVEEPAPDGVTFRLDGRTKVIRADNEDSFQGPIPEAADVASRKTGQERPQSHTPVPPEPPDNTEVQPPQLPPAEGRNEPRTRRTHEHLDTSRRSRLGRDGYRPCTEPRCLSRRPSGHSGRLE